MGYEIAELEKNIDGKKETYQQLLEEKNMLTNKDRLYKIGKEIGLILPSMDKVFYVN